jgi:hypothetical protein
MCYNALYNLTLTKTTVVRFVGTGGFSIRYSIGHTKLTQSPVKKFLDYLQQQKHHSLKKSKLKSSHYRNVSTDPLETGRGSLGTRGPQTAHHCVRTYDLIRSCK